MTKERTYEGGTEFSLWIRKEIELDSKLGYRAYDIDFVWKNVNTGEWLLLEEKRYGWDDVKSNPHMIFAQINKLCAKDKLYRGYHLLAFENTSPEDGRIQLNYQDITKEDLIKFFQFDKKILKKYMDFKNAPVSEKFKGKIVENLNKLK